MPQRDVKDIDVAKIDHSNIREPGYEWMKDRFGPPPGIPRKEKERLEIRQEVIAERRDQLKIKQFSLYKYAEEMMLHMELVKTVYKSNDYEEFRTYVEMLQLYHKLEDGETLVKKMRPNHEMELDVDEPKEVESHPEMALDLKKIVQNGKVKDDDEGKLLVKRLTCQLCKSKMSGAVFLPCGCFALCHDCCQKDKQLPLSCPRCHKRVRGACRAIL